METLQSIPSPKQKLLLTSSKLKPSECNTYEERIFRMFTLTTHLKTVHIIIIAESDKDIVIFSHKICRIVSRKSKLR